MEEEQELAKQLIAYRSDKPEGICQASNFVATWLKQRGIAVERTLFGDLPLLKAEVGATDKDAPTVVFHGHIDVVPAHEDQFLPRVEGDRLYGRGAYDMKGGLAAMLCALTQLKDQNGVRTVFICAPDEESEEVNQRSTEMLLAAGDIKADFAITGEPTDLHVGIQAKGVLAVNIEVKGRAAHGSTPWLGDNAVLKAVDIFRSVESLPFSRQSSEMFDRPSINLGRINGGDALNKVPDLCVMDLDIRYLPGQQPEEILEQIKQLPEISVRQAFTWPPAVVSPQNHHVGVLAAAARRVTGDEALSVGRDGASDAASFINHGVPAVEFGPTGAGHHGPEEWVSLSSLTQYRQVLTEFVLALFR